MRTLETLTIRNFKSIRDQTLRLGPLNIFIGGNGSGKSNLIEVFRFLHEIVEQRLASTRQSKVVRTRCFTLAEGSRRRCRFRLSLE